MTENAPQTTPGAPQASEPVDTGTDTPEPEIFDATNPEGIQQLPAVMTSMTPAMFKTWLDADGELFMVMLPGRASFIIKVPTVHNAFFVSMLQQVKFALGPEVQAVRMNVVSGKPPDADGTAAEAPPWAQPPGGATHTEHVDTASRHGNQCATPDCVLDAGHPDHHESQAGASWRTYAEPTEHVDTGPTTTGRARCTGSNKPGVNVQGSDRSCWRGQCIECGWAGKLTWSGDIRAHPTRNSDPLLKPLPRGDGPAFA